MDRRCANTNEEKKEICDALYEIWIKQPEQRLGQLLSNTSFEKDPFYITDYKFIDILNKQWASKGD